MQHHNQYKSSIRDDFTLSYSKGGRHDLKMGGEYINDLSILRGCGSTCRPTLVAQNGAPSYALLQQALPVWNDPSTWNLNLLAPFAQRYELGIVDPGTKAYYAARNSQAFMFERSPARSAASRWTPSRPPDDSPGAPAASGSPASAGLPNNRRCRLKQ